DGELEPLLARRLRHVRTENDRVRRVVAALEAGATASLGPLFRAGHDSLRDDFEVSTPELDLLVDRAYEAGALAARMTGGGFGGSIVVLAEADEAHALAEDVVAAYRERTGRDGRFYVCASVDGASAGL